MNVIYHARRPFLPQLACALHLGLENEAEPFLPESRAHDWQAEPLLIAGPDATGATVCCLAHGRYRGLYRRALAGMAGIFTFSLAWVDLDQAIAACSFATRGRVFLADHWPAVFGHRFRPRIIAALRSSLLTHREDCP
ncbi:hypothetical protein [Anaeroselena agilis]|uniref:Uncharacterized protein n=1 Tax=Anaeroselena agilis TaxID=3063788 RepID=A0ABU3NWK2_9FIRM|nr:hypothetical protein [Selenomonadales bacterium 4137-cl]